MAVETCDVIVIGAGASGESVAWRLARRGTRVALVERELIGGACTYWACVPSKTLLRPVSLRGEARRAFGTGELAVAWDAVRAYRDYMTRGWDDTKQVEEYRAMGVRVFKAPGRIAGPGRVVVGSTEIVADEIVIATGSEPFAPPIAGLEDVGFWTTRDVTSLQTIPASIAIIGGGPASIELGQMLARYGSAVTLIAREPRLFPHADARVGDELLAALEADNIRCVFDATVEAVSRHADLTRLELADGSGVDAAALLVATGRRPSVDGFGLETLDLGDVTGGIPIDAHGHATDGVWAVGDVTAVAMLTHVAKYQGRLVADNILGSERILDYRAVPRVIFTDPEIAFVGSTAGVDDPSRITSATVEMADVGASYIHEREPRGFLTLGVDAESREVVGATAVGPMASEWIHLAMLAVRERITAESLFESIFQFPSYAEAFIAAAEQLR